MARGSVQSLERGVALLEALGRAGRPLTVRELSIQVRLPRPTVYRLLQTLAACGLVASAERGHVLGPRILSLAAQRLEQIELRAAWHGRLRALRDQTGETVHLAVLEQGQVVYIDKVESSGPLRMASAVGKIMPAHCTALGKAMLAFMPPAAARRVLRDHGLPRRTANTITDPVRFFEELAQVHARGFAIDNIENEEGIRCVAAPIFDHRGQVAGAVSLSGAASSITLDRARRELGPQVRRAALDISRALGWTEARVSEEDRVP
ncbi:MAG: IclR family transcriptional regulator [Firmicutes bacterium]|nr:IclR family transcriptional regulator [Bacillota bacterium]